MKRDGTTSKGTARWWCKRYGMLSVKRRSDITNSTVFATFIGHLITDTSLDTTVSRVGCSPRTLQRRFEPFWFADVPDPTVGYIGRVYDQVFLDDTYIAGGYLIIAVTINHAIAWHWHKHKATRNYQRLLEHIEAPLIVVIDGGQEAFSAIKEYWPITKIQRYLVHVQHVVRRYTTSQPRINAGRITYRLVLKLTRITTLDQAVAWGAQLYELSMIYRSWMNEKTTARDPKTSVWTRT